jgi:hypothetical protein
LLCQGKDYVFSEVIANLQLLPGRHQIHILTDSAPPPFGHYYGRENCIWVTGLEEKLRQAFLASDEDSCFFLEADQPVLPHVPQALMDRDVDIVMAATPARVIPHRVNACDKKDAQWSLPLPAGELIGVGSVGMGCTLIKRHVLETVGWEDPEALVDKYGRSGDFTICKQYTEKTGVYPFVDCGVVVEHVDSLDGRLVRHTFRDEGGLLEAVTL